MYSWALFSFSPFAQAHHLYVCPKRCVLGAPALPLTSEATGGKFSFIHEVFNKPF